MQRYLVEFVYPKNPHDSWSTGGSWQEVLFASNPREAVDRAIGRQARQVDALGAEVSAVYEMTRVLF